jgi:hypothetical protein
MGVFKFFDELWRVMKVDGEVAIATPHGNSQGFLQDPSHINAMNENSFFYFTPGHKLYGIYRPKPWKIKGGARFWAPNANIEIVMVKLPEDTDG